MRRMANREIVSACRLAGLSAFVAVRCWPTRRVGEKIFEQAARKAQSARQHACRLHLPPVEPAEIPCH